MEKSDLFESYISRLENIKENLHPSDFRFYNISHFPLLIKNTIEKADLCPTCKINLKLTSDLVNSMPDCFENPVDRKIFEKQKNKLESHLKKNHGMKLPGYYTALYSLIGIIVSVAISMFLHFTKGLSFFNEVILITLAIGIGIGRGIGTFLDRKIFSKNLQL